MELREETLSQETIYDGKILALRRDMARLEDGSEAVREVLVHPGGVCVVPIDAEGMLYTVRQFRYPMMAVTEELPAGKLDGAGEDPGQAALRELSEEIGATPGSFVSLGKLLASPGFCTEVLHLYLARELTFAQAHPDPDEFLQLCRTPFDEAVEKVMDGTLTDAKTVAGILKAREYLRREAGGKP